MASIIRLQTRSAHHTQAQTPGLKGFSDIYPTSPRDAAAIGFVLAQLRPVKGPILWIRDRMTGLETGEMYLAQRISGGMVQCALKHPVSVLQAMEDGLGSSGIGAVVGELWGDPRELDFTATKRLAMRTEARGIPCILLRHNAHPNLSAARNRLRISSLPSAINTLDPPAPGDPRWRVELFRSRTQAPGAWVVRHDRAQDRLDFTPVLTDGAVGEDSGARGHASS